MNRGTEGFEENSLTVMSFSFLFVVGLQGTSGELNDVGLPLFFTVSFFGVETTGEPFFMLESLTFAFPRDPYSIILISLSGQVPSRSMFFPISERYLSRSPSQ